MNSRSLISAFLLMLLVTLSTVGLAYAPPYTGFEKTWGGTHAETALNVAVDTLGNIYVAGGTSSWALGQDAFILKYDPDGNLIWQKTWGGNAGTEYGQSVAVGELGNIYVAGYGSSFGVDLMDAFILKYDPDGNLIWQKTWGGAGGEFLYDMAVGELGNIYVVGDTTSFGADGDALILKYDPDGNLIWQKTWGGNAGDVARCVATQDGKIYVAGLTLSFGAGGDALILKYDPDGNLIWQKTWGGSNREFPDEVAVGELGNIYVVGHTNSFGIGPKDAFILKYDPDGNLIWQKTWGGANNDSGKGVAVGELGNIYVVGFTESFGGTLDVFILKYDPDGNLIWQKTWGGSDDDHANNVSVFSCSVYVVGGTRAPAGPWVLNDVSGTETTPTGTETTPTGTETTPTGTETTPTGTETTPSGEPAQGGEDSFLISLVEVPHPVIPEVPLGTIMASAAMIIALIAYVAVPKWRSKWAYVSP